MQLYNISKVVSHARLVGGIGLAISALACGNKGAPAGAADASPPKATDVGVVVVEREQVRIVSELPGRTVPYEVSEIRPQVSGILQRKLFTEGSVVSAGQVLYEIDPQIYAVAVEQARANLSSAEASLLASKAKSDRYKSLVEIDAVSKQDQMDAQAAALQAEGLVKQTRAALAAAEINLGFSKVKAPISGRIGRSLVTTGALVTTAQAQPLAVIQRTDPMYVDIPQSAVNLLEMRRAMKDGGLKRSVAQVRLRLEDGTEYPQLGELGVTEASVDQSTGSVILRAKFPNKQGELLPGMYVQASVVQGDVAAGILIPQAGVLRSPTGEATAYVVDAESKIAVRKITLIRTVGNKWLIGDGLEVGDKVVVEGISKVRPGQLVNPLPPMSAAEAK